MLAQGGLGTTKDTKGHQGLFFITLVLFVPFAVKKNQEAPE